MPDKNITFIDNVEIKNKRILLRVDFNVSLTLQNQIADDARIQQALPTINHLLKNGNKLILVTHFGRPKGRDEKLSNKVVADRLQGYLPTYKVKLINDFLTENKETFVNQKEDEIFMLENIRFYPEEKKNDPQFAAKLAALADVYVNDAFGVSHRADASIVGVPTTMKGDKSMPSYGGLLLKRETEMISKAINNPRKPMVAIIGGAKISNKISLIGRLMEIADYLIVGGGLANTFLAAQGFNIGKSICEHEELDNARRLFFNAAQKHTTIQLPVDVIVGTGLQDTNSVVKKIEDVTETDFILDIGPETQAKYSTIIAPAKTIVWNGPVGYFENPVFRRGTDFIYYAIAHNNGSTLSIVGGGDTLAAISKKEYLDHITHISTGGGAMLEFIEKGTLPGIEALKKTS